MGWAGARARGVSLELLHAPPPHYVLQSVFSSGSIFCFVVVVSLVAYVGGGMLYKRLTKGAAPPAGTVLFRFTNSAVVACVCPVLL